MKNLIVDLDGTLVVCGRYYAAANEEVADTLAHLYGVEKELALELMAFIDVWAIRINKADGFRKERFPKSLAAAVAVTQFMTDPNGWIYPSVMEWALHRGNEVFDFEKSPYTPFEGALETLQQYRDAGWQVTICTKGDPEVQAGKIARHGIDKIAHHVEIVPRKDPEMLRHVCEKLGIDPATAVYVGDSVRDDMVPAKALGMKAVRVGTRSADKWLFDSSEDKASDEMIESFRDLPTAVPL